ncbi:MAG: acyl-CoA thioester hydrolase/BAAT C-terminal domain-containing protein [Pseudomonadota bacterium]
MNGKALPFVPPAKTPDYSITPYRGTPDFLNDLNQTELVNKASIPVEKIHGAVLLLSGEDDQVWPSSIMADRVMKRLRDAGHPYRSEHVVYPGAGHLISPGAGPAVTEAKHPIGIVIAFGGSEAGNRAAQKAAWEKVMVFLRTDIQSQAP